MPDAVEVGRILIGRAYRHHHLKVVNLDGTRVVMDVRLGSYKTLGFAYDGETRRELLLLEGLEGGDKGQLIVFTPYRFCLCFDLIPLSDPETTDEPPGNAGDSSSA